MVNEPRILIISEAHLIITFVQTAIIKIKEETNASFDCMITTAIDEATTQSLKTVFDKVFVNEYPRGILKSLPKTKTIQTVYGLRKLVRTLPHYDIIHVQFHFFYYSLIASVLRKKAKKFFITFFGSDFYSLNSFQHRLTKRSVEFADHVFAINNSTLQKIVEQYKIPEYSPKPGILSFLMNNLASFEKFINNNTVDSARRMWGFQKKIIVCGYSAANIMRHKTIIDALKPLANRLLEYQIIFPMTYGWRGEETKAMVKAELEHGKLDSLVVENFLTVEKLQGLRLSADIFIHITKSDQMSASMLEHLAAGSVVITGKWLPYSGLIEKGVYMIMIASPDDLSKVLPEVLDNLEMHKANSCINRNIILDIVKWELVKINWYKYYELKQSV